MKMSFGIDRSCELGIGNAISELGIGNEISELGTGNEISSFRK